jgi:hypothetical protein
VIPEDERRDPPDEVRVLRREAGEARRALRVVEARVREVEGAHAEEAARLTTEAAASRKRALAAERRIAQSSAAVAAGLDLDLADRLQGDSEDELLADAQRLASL